MQIPRLAYVLLGCGIVRAQSSVSFVLTGDSTTATMLVDYYLHFNSSRTVLISLPFLVEAGEMAFVETLQSEPLRC